MSRFKAKKIGMTQIFSENGIRYPVTVIEMQLPEGKDNNIENFFKVGDFIDVSGNSKGCGFQGGMKRWNWSGTPKTHGSTSHRRVGSIGASADPSRVLRGTHMPGHMGNKKVTVQNIKVLKLDNEANLLVIKGSIPGHKNTDLVIRKAIKKPLNTDSKKDDSQVNKENKE